MQAQKKTPTSNEMEVVNHPAHYKANGLECIEVMRAVFGDEAVFHFCLLNAFKYLFRCDSKHETPIEDLGKARWYLDYIIKNKDNDNEDE